jgi:Uma2 family endonuclease
MKAKKLSRSKRQSDEGVKNIVIPDIFVMCEPSRMKVSSGTYYGTPSLVVEVRSPSTETVDFDYKKILYESCEVKEYIIVLNYLTAVHYVLGADSVYRSTACDSAVSRLSQEGVLTIPSSQFPELTLTIKSSWFEEFEDVII